MVAGQPDRGEFIPETEFRALAVAVRLVYMEKEPSSFARVTQILRSVGDSDVLEAVERIERKWKSALDGRGSMVHQAEGQTFQPRDVLDTWLYALTLHQDQRKQGHADAIRRFGPSATMTLQFLVCVLAAEILNLDSAVAYVLGEGHRIGVPPEFRDPGAGLF
jgi:hypothetical protein